MISLSKLKTLEYRVYRKLREKLRNYLKSNKSNIMGEFKNLYQKFVSEVKDLCGNIKTPKPLAYYNDVAIKALNFAKNYPKEHYRIHD